MKRHIGKLANTDQRLVVVFMQIPGREDHALVLPTDTLPARYEQAVMEILESNEGQRDEVLGNTLARRLMPDTGKQVLQALHEGNMLKAVPVANILMMPKPNMPFPLVTLLEQMGKSLVPTTAAPAANATSKPDMNAVEKYNQIAVNQQIDNIENRRAVAQNLIIEADMLSNEAAKKRDRAYTIAPEMKPIPPGPAKVAPEPVAEPVAEDAAKSKGKK